MHWSVALLHPLTWHFTVLPSGFSAVSNSSNQSSKATKPLTNHDVFGSEFYANGTLRFKIEFICLYDSIVVRCKGRRLRGRRGTTYSKPRQDIWFSHTGIANQDKFEQIIVFVVSQHLGRGTFTISITWLQFLWPECTHSVDWLSWVTVPLFPF